MTEERIQKIIARAGLASRRGAEQMISEGRVTVNGKIAQLGDKADPKEDRITVDGKLLPKAEPLRYYIVNKPRGVLSSLKEQEDLPNVKIISDLVPSDVRIYPVGRLDLNSEGLVLMTNDGELTNLLTHPRYGHTKTYKVTLSGNVNENALNRWQSGGITLPDGFVTSPCSIKVLEVQRRSVIVRIILKEGHKHQIRETAEVLGMHVERLIRTHIGPLALGDLLPGHYRELSRREIEVLYESVKKQTRRHKEKPQRKSRRHENKR
ncbi:MAG: hypothetical protein CUN55_02010 [Phototrophicales bacterium]|nr:MAG: hypothetical protein CUN55_02010 [Phototrophicales bacterium]